MHALKSLIELSNHYGTDKGTMTPKEGWGRPHNYADIYQAYFCEQRDAPLKILEIGAGVTGPNWETGIVGGRNEGGASIKVWYDFFPNATIHTIDINPADFLNNDRTAAFVADQGSPESLAGFLSKAGGNGYDIIIDDGSHNSEHQQVSLGVLFETLNSGGYYFIEDLLNNGQGDGSKRRNASEAVRNTRDVLKGLTTNGALATPNMIVNPDAFARSVAFVNFHCPRVMPILIDKKTNERVPNLKKYQGGKDTNIVPWFEFDAEFEMLCAIKKR